MKFIIGLGNPGLIYSGSRHNIGFEVVKNLACLQNIVLKKEKGIKALSGKGRLGNLHIMLGLPVTFMNLSGDAVSSLLKKYKVDLSDLLIVCDDLDLEFGRIKICAKGSSAGHRGIKSVAELLNNPEFNRLRVGIGRPKGSLSASDFVLSRFKRSERQKLPGIINKASQCCISWAEEGIEKTMNIFNRKDTKGAEL